MLQHKLNWAKMIYTHTNQNKTETNPKFCRFTADFPWSLCSCCESSSACVGVPCWKLSRSIYCTSFTKFCRSALLENTLSSVPHTWLDTDLHLCLWMYPAWMVFKLSQKLFLCHSQGFFFPSSASGVTGYFGDAKLLRLGRGGEELRFAAPAFRSWVCLTTPIK